MTYRNNSEAARLFNEDTKNRKNVAHSASKRVGQKKGCSFTKHSAEDLARMNGPCVTYKLAQPMSWAEFTAAPAGVKEEYMCGLYAKFHIGIKDLTTLFKCTELALVTHLKKHGLDGILPMESSQTDRKGFMDFIQTRFQNKKNDYQQHAVVATSDNVQVLTAKMLKACRADNDLTQKELSILLYGTANNAAIISRAENLKLSAAQAADLLAKLKTLEGVTQEEPVAVSNDKPVKPTKTETRKPEETRVDCGDAFRTFRQYYGFSQRKLAEILKISQNSVSCIERGGKLVEPHIASRFESAMQEAAKRFEAEQEAKAAAEAETVSEPAPAELTKEPEAPAASPAEPEVQPVAESQPAESASQASTITLSGSAGSVLEMLQRFLVDKDASITVTLSVG